MPRYPVLSFNAGEISPMVDARSDVDKYSAGCRTLENMIPRIYGPAERRPGTKYIDTCNGVARDLPFIYSNSISYILLLEDQRMWFYYGGGRVLDIQGRRLGIDTPYLAADMFEIQYKQSNDVMWLVHPDYPQHKLGRTSANSFSLDQIVFKNGPFKKRNDLANDDGITLAPSVTDIDATGTLTASSATFDSGHVGALFSITQPRVNTEVSGLRAVVGCIWTVPADEGPGYIGSPILVEGSFTFVTHGTWSGTIVLQRSIDYGELGGGATWETYRKWTSSADANAQYTGTEEEYPVWYRIYVSEISANIQAGTTTIWSIVRAELSVNSSTQMGICRVTGYTSPTQVSMEVVRYFASTNADKRWQEGCWSDYRGFPTAVTFFQSRCIYGGTRHQPQTVWLSATDDFENFLECTKDSASFSLTMSSDTRNAIQWMSSLEAVIIGTAGNEWMLRADSTGEPLTPTNFELSQQTTYGSKAIQALPVNDAILFVDSVGRRVREATYEGGKDKYVAPDLCALAEHITATGITSIAFQKNPDPILWAIRQDGTLLSMTYEREQDVIAWARHPFHTGGSASGTDTTTTPNYAYPVLQDLDSSEVPASPTAPADIAMVSSIAVTDAAGLQAMTGGNHYSIDSDIDLTGVPWTPLTFNSASQTVIEGNNHTISNLTVGSANANLKAFIGSITGTGGGQIRNLTLDNCTVTSATSSAIFLGYISEGSFSFKNITVSNCTLIEDRSIPIDNEPEYMAMLVGGTEASDLFFYDCNAVNCTTTGDSYGGAYLGGLVGEVGEQSAITTTTFLDCAVEGGAMNLRLGSPVNIGGFIGEAYEVAGSTTQNYVFYNCSSSVALNFTSGDSFLSAKIDNMGGFVGYSANASYTGCNATGAITVSVPDTWAIANELKCIGGFLGQSAGFNSLTNCYSTGAMTFSGAAGAPQLDGVGGFAGDLYGGDACLHCYSTSGLTVGVTLSRLTGVGGFVGEIYSIGTLADPSIERCWSTGDISFAGGITDAPVIANDGTHPSYGGIGGFAGFATYDATAQGVNIENCYAWGSVSITGSYDSACAIGGFIGSWGADRSDVLFTNCYCAQTNSAAGSGLTNQLPLLADSHGFGGGGGTTNIVVTDCYFDQQTSSTETSAVATAQTTAWLQTKTNFQAAGWDFTDIWYIADGTTTTYDTSGLGPNSVAVIPSTTEDEVWLVISRFINGAIVRYLEQMQPRRVTDREDKWFVDSGLDYDGDPDTTFSGLDHLEGEEVVIWADGAVFTRQTVTNGSITLPEPASRVIVGLPFRYKLKPMRFDLTSGMDTSKGSLKRCAEVVISFYETLNAEYGVDEDHLFKMDWRTEEAHGSGPDFYTNDKVVHHEGGFDPEDSFIITGDDPCPCTVRAIVPRVEMTGR